MYFFPLGLRVRGRGYVVLCYYTFVVRSREVEWIAISSCIGWSSTHI